MGENDYSIFNDLLEFKILSEWAQEAVTCSPAGSCLKMHCPSNKMIRY